MDSLTSTSETRENVFPFFLFHHLFFLEYVFTYAVGSSVSSKKYLVEINQKKIKSSSQKCFTGTRFNFSPMKNIFRKI